VLPVLDDRSCCTPLAREPLAAADADLLAVRFKALAVPVRLRLLSLVLSHDGGEACVCDLNAVFDLSQTAGAAVRPVGRAPHPAYGST
jgi:ArsR family transcriptional regulator, arsenate/arsenite/antimonite-responsive transcriptional repressor